jgi:hypothetical protein
MEIVDEHQAAHGCTWVRTIFVVSKLAAAAVKNSQALG